MVYIRNLSHFNVDEKKEHIYHTILGFIRENNPRYRIVLQDDASCRLKIPMTISMFIKATAYLDVSYDDKGSIVSIRTEKSLKRPSDQVSDYTLSDRHTALEMNLRAYFVRQGFKCDYKHHHIKETEHIIKTLKETIVAKNDLTQDDILALGEALYDHDTPTEADIQALFDIQQKCAKKCNEWNLFFVNAVSVYYAHHAIHNNNLTEDHEKELIEKIEADGVIDIQTELRILINLLNYIAHPSPFFKSYVLKAVKDHILDGHSSLYGQDAPREKAISFDDLEALKLVLYGNNEDRNDPICGTEIALLFELDQETNTSHNIKEWDHFFTKSLTHYVTGSHKNLTLPEQDKRFETVKDHFQHLSKENRLSEHHHLALSHLKTVDSRFNNVI